MSRLDKAIAASAKPWLQRILNASAPRQELAAPDINKLRQPERMNGPITGAGKTRPSGRASTTTPAPAFRKPSLPVFTVAATAPVPRADNVGPGRQRAVLPSERMASLRARLTAQAKDFGDALPRNPTEEARGELDQLWRRIRALTEAIEVQQGREAADAERGRRSGRERGD